MSHAADSPGGGIRVKKIWGGIKDGAQTVWAYISDQPPPCRHPECSKPCYVEDNGRIHDYCGKTHAQEHKVIMMNEEAARQRRSRAKRGGGKQNKHDWGQGKQLISNTSGASGWDSHQQHQQGCFQCDHQYSLWNSDGPIHFYNRDEPFYEFTNFYNGAPIKLDDKEWKTAEHYFQAQKFVGTPYVELIRNAQGPRDAFNYSRDPSISRWRRSDWEEVKIDIMRKALYAKFDQSGWLKRRLLETGKRELVERSPYDSFWGDGGDGSGENYLGKLLMELRSKLCEDIQRDNCKQPQQVSYETHSCGSAASGTVAGGIPIEEMTRPPLHPDQQKNEPKTGLLIDVGEQASSLPAHLPAPLTPIPATPSQASAEPEDAELKPDEPEPMEEN